MTPDRRELLRTVTVLGGTGLGVSVAGCAGQQTGTTPTETGTERSTTATSTDRSTTPSPTETPASVVTVATHAEYGEILVDSNGRTLYVFARDSDGESVCYDDCAAAWPPLTVESADAFEAGSGVTADLGTTEREDGSLQVTADGMPLYYFARDRQPGDATGMGVINAWFLLRPDGSVHKPTVSTRDHPDLGEILTDADGRTLYMFERDEGGRSVCYDDCAAAWPPLTVESEDALVGSVKATVRLGTSEREDGSLQVTGNEMPLYYFAEDGEPGDATGHGVGDVWFVLRPDGSVVTDATPTPTPTPTPADSDGSDGADDDSGGGNGGY